MMNRRDFLKMLGMGAVAVAAMPAAIIAPTDDELVELGSKFLRELRVGDTVHLTFTTPPPTAGGAVLHGATTVQGSPMEIAGNPIKPITAFSYNHIEGDFMVRGKTVGCEGDGLGRIHLDLIGADAEASITFDDLSDESPPSEWSLTQTPPDPWNCPPIKEPRT